jgi:Aspartyl protease
MKSIKFKRQTEDSLIILKCHFPDHEIALALDTGASHTTIDLTALQIAGYDISNAFKMIKIETASGIIDGYLLIVKEFTALGITKNDIVVCTYDFFAHHVLSDFDGVLGLDFIDEYKICVDFKKSIITLQE